MTSSPPEANRLKAFLAAIALASFALLVGLLLGGSGGIGNAEHDGPFAENNARHEAAFEGREKREAVFERGNGGEASRGAASSPAAEQVAERAFPRNYVSDTRARKSENAFDAIPSRPSRSSFDTPQDAAQAGPAGPWDTLGPTTPNVPGVNSQFFDPQTLTGPDTQESGRVTAIAIDPACAPSNCRMWVAAAGGGIWRTADALAATPQWTAPPDDLPTNAFGSLYFDPNAGANGTIYAGSGEPNGSSDSEAGLGLFKSTDNGATWSLVPGSSSVATSRSIGAIVTDPTDPNTIYIGTDVARHGSASVNGGRRTPPNAPTLGVYRSTDGGANFTLESDLSNKTPPSPNPPSGGSDWFQGGINKLELDPNNPDALYAGVFGYGVWRADQSVATPTWGQVFHTMNQNDFSNPNNPVGDTTGDRTEFDLVDLGANTRAYVGDASDDWATDAASANTPLPEAWRNDDVAAITASTNGSLNNATAGWNQLSSATNGTPGFGVYGYCQNGQCGYDSFVAHPPGAGADTVWYGGSMNYDELAAYDQLGQGAPPRSNGRAVIRSTDAGATPANTATWQDMTAILSNPTQAWGVQVGIHPDLHTIAFANNGATAFIGSDGGVVRINTSSTQDQTASCAQRQWNYDPNDPTTPPVPLQPADLADCQMLLDGVPNSITPLNDGLNDLQFQSLSYNPTNPGGSLLGGTQDNGTWLFNGSQPSASQWFESVGGDGGQSGFDVGDPSIRYHNYFNATPEVNFNGGDPDSWYAIYDPLQASNENQSFYAPFITDPNVAGRAFIGLEHVWRTDDHGGSQSYLDSNGCSSLDIDPFRTSPCGDWVPMGGNLTGPAYGQSRNDPDGYVAAVERAKCDDGTLWAATRNGRLFVSKNADQSPVGNVQFNRIDNAATPGRFISGISIDPGDPNHAFISYNGYNAYTPSTPGHVFEVTYNPTSHSATFTDRSLNIGDQPVTDVAYDGATGDLYAATDFGVLRLPSGSNQWVDAAGGMPKAAVYGLTLAGSGRLLLAATHGRGAYSLQLPSAPQPQCPSPTPTPTPTPTPGPTSQPKGTLQKIKVVKKGKPTIIKGTATDPAGVASVLVKFGDNKKAKPRLNPNGSFTLKHRYRKVKTYTVRIVVTGSGGKTAVSTRNARVKK